MQFEFSPVEKIRRRVANAECYIENAIKIQCNLEEILFNKLFF